jgi:hypothetical protein
MDVRITILVIALGVASLTLAPTLLINQSADAQSKDSNQWVWGCQSGWFDHDHCQEYYPVNSKAGYKAGWDHGNCK